VPSGSAEGETLNNASQTYATVVSELKNSATSSVDNSILANLPKLDPYGGTSYDISSSQLKAFGVLSGTDPGINGAIGIATDWPSVDYVAAMLHEITHAMGHNSGWSAYGETDLLDLTRFSAPGKFTSDGSLTSANSLQYFSIDGGKTKLANYSATSDFGDYASDTLTSNDPMNAYLTSNSNQLSALDIKTLDAMGYTIVPTARA
jgi:hypothetical protein